MSRAPEPAGEQPHERLTKRDVETLLDAYDTDPVSALLEALDSIAAPASVRSAVATMATPDRDALLKDLVEWRGLAPTTGSDIDS